MIMKKIVCMVGALAFVSAHTAFAVRTVGLKECAILVVAPVGTIFGVTRIIQNCRIINCLYEYEKASQEGKQNKTQNSWHVVEGIRKELDKLDAVETTYTNTTPTAERTKCCIESAVLLGVTGWLGYNCYALARDLLSGEYRISWGRW